MENDGKRVAGYSKHIAAVVSSIMCGLLLACGGQGSGIPAGEPEQVTLAQLEQELNKALAERGIDPAKAVSRAPIGNVNKVFDLEATLDDADGPGGAPALVAELSWTEVLIGDYDSNSEVGLPDLQPLVLYFAQSVPYAEPGVPGGCKFWPQGDPEGSAADRLNWRTARADGNRNGEINAADIQEIAVNWGTRLAGYNVYAKAPGSAEFSLIEALPRPNLSASPMRYHFDYTFAAAGVYDFYIAPYDPAGVQGTASPLLRIDNAAGTVRHEPVAILETPYSSVTPPREIRLYANESYCRDGGIAAFKWDFDSDGVVDWVSTDAIPAASSTGVVDNITLDFPLQYGKREPGMVQVRFTEVAQGTYQPTVWVVDANGWEVEASVSINFGN